MGSPVPQAEHILTIENDNLPRPGGTGAWTKKLAGGQFMVGPNPRHAWISVFDPASQFDRPLTGISGTIVNDPHVSSADLPFTHPFGSDYEFHVAPDAPFRDLAAPDMRGSYLESTRRARDVFGIDVPGVIGLEMDRGLVPRNLFDPQQGHRVAMWGRLIVDAGHTDFHTEIHPALAMVAARQHLSSQQAKGSQNPDATTVDITTRPFLVSQDFDHGGLFDQLSIQLAEAFATPTGRIDAHPRLMPRPFEGLNSIFFDVRPPTPRRRSRDRLFLESRITQRSGGVAMKVIKHPKENDAVRVLIILNEHGYVVPPEPTRRDTVVSLPELTGTKIAGGIGIGALFAGVPPHVAFVVGKGFPTHTYDHPRAVSPGHDTSRTRRAVDDLPANIPTNKDDRQVYPLFGTLTLEWERHVGPPVKKKATHKPGEPPPII